MCKKPDVRLAARIKEHKAAIKEQTQVTVPHLRLIHRQIKEKIFPEKP